MTQSERPLAGARPFLVLAGIGGLAIFILVLAMLRDPGMPAHVQEDYLRVAGGLLRPEIPLPEVDSLSVQLRDRFGHSVRVPALAAHRFTLEGGAISEPGGTPAAVAIYHSHLRDLLVWHAYAGSVSSLPETNDVRERDGREYFVHRKATNTLVFWQNGPLVEVITCGLPSEQVFNIALTASKE